MRKSIYTDTERAYAVSIVGRFSGSYEAAARYLKDEGKLSVSAKTLRNWSNDVTLERIVPVEDALVVAAEAGCLAAVGDEELLANATKGLSAVVDRLNERLADDRYTKRITNNELVNIGSFFASLKSTGKEQQGTGGSPNIYQQIINQHYHAAGA